MTESQSSPANLEAMMAKFINGINSQTNIDSVMVKLDTLKESLARTEKSVDRLEAKVDLTFASKERVIAIEGRLNNVESDLKLGSSSVATQLQNLNGKIYWMSGLGAGVAFILGFVAKQFFS